MKVLHILCELNPSGAETMLLCAAPYMQAQGVDNEILATGKNVGVFAAPLEKAGYKVHHIPFGKNPQYFLAIYSLVKSGRYGSVHIHSEQASFWVTLILLIAGIPTKRCIRTIHSNFAFAGNLRWRRAWQRQLLSYIGVPHIAISTSVQATELKNFNIKTKIISNWFNSHHFVKTTEAKHLQCRENLNITANEFVIVTVGNCSHIKNHPALIQAISALGERRVVYLHVGIEKDNNEQVVAKQLGINNQIRFIGQQNDVLPYLQAADLYVMSSLYEGSSIAALEAIATEVPVLLTDVPGLKDFSATFNGLIYCEPTADSIQMALKQIIDTPKDILRQAAAGNAKKAEEFFGIERSVSAYIAHYKAE
jgi:glycosyltransferase involved in cell wall biosynthesis